MPEDVKLFSSIYAELTLKISDALKAGDMTQKDLAEQMGKRPSEISKWLNGGHNFTLRSLCKLQAELGVKLIEVPKEDVKIIRHDFTGKKSVEFKISNTPVIQLANLGKTEFKDKFVASTK